MSFLGSILSKAWSGVEAIKKPLPPPIQAQLTKKQIAVPRIQAAYKQSLPLLQSANKAAVDRFPITPVRGSAIPRFNVAPAATQNIKNPVKRTVARIGGEIANELLNVPTDIGAGAYQYLRAINSRQTPREQASNLLTGGGRLGMGVFNLATAGVGPKAAIGALGGLTKTSLKQAAIKGAKSGAKLGAASGGLYGIIGQEGDSLTRQVGKGIKGSAIGALGGAVIGGGVASLPSAAGSPFRAFIRGKASKVRGASPKVSMGKNRVQQIGDDAVDALRGLDSNDFTDPRGNVDLSLFDRVETFKKQINRAGGANKDERREALVLLNQVYKKQSQSGFIKIPGTGGQNKGNKGPVSQPIRRSDVGDATLPASTKGGVELPVDQQAKNLTPDGIPTTPGINQETQAIVPRQSRPGLVRKVRKMGEQSVLESRTILKKQGPTGEKIAQSIDEVYDDAERAAGTLVADYNQVKKSVGKKDIERVLRALDGQQVQLTPQQEQAAIKIRGQLDMIADESTRIGLEIKRPDGTKVPFAARQNYFPHIVDEKALEKNRELVIAHFVRTNQIPDISTATKLVDTMIDGVPLGEAYQRFFPKNSPARMGNLEASRVLDFPKEVLRFDSEVLADYFTGATKRLKQAEVYGPNNEAFTTLLEGVGMEGGDPKVAEDILLRNMGITKDSKTIRDGISALKRIEGLTKLGLASVSNIGQSVNTATKFGIRNTFNAITKAFGGEGREFALRSGATLDDALRQIEEEVGRGGLMNKFTAPGFKAVESFNRTVAANAGRNFALKRFNAALKNPADMVARQDLVQLGINVDKALQTGSLSTDDLLRAGQKATNFTQFKTRPIDLPPTWSSSTGRLLTQFKSFGYKQGQFVKNEVMKKAAKGNLGPLTRYLLLGLVVGEFIGDAKALVRNRERPTGLARAGDNLATIGGFGTLQDATNAALRGEQAMLSFITGPVIGDTARLAGGIGAAVKGQPKTLGKFLTGNIPIVGQPIKNTLFPTQGAYKSRTPDLVQEVVGGTVTYGSSGTSSSAQKSPARRSTSSKSPSQKLKESRRKSVSR